MFSQDHVIMRQQLEVTVAHHRYIKDIQAIIEEIVQDELNQLLDHVFSQYVPYDVVITVDRLVIDDIVCEKKKLKEQLIQKIRETLCSTLKKKINAIIKDPQKRQIVPLLHAKINALQHYLIHGTFAWWLTINTDKEIEKIYTELLYQHPKVLQTFWFSTHHPMQVTKRFVTHFSDSLIVDTIKLLSNVSQSTHNYEIIEEIIALQKGNPLLFLNQEKFIQTIWETTLMHFLTTTHSETNVYYFTKTILKKLAIVSNTSYVDVLRNAAAHYEKKEEKDTAISKLNTIVKQLYEALSLPPQRIYYNPTIILIQQLNQDFSSSAFTQLLQRSDEPGVKETLHSWIQLKKNKLPPAKNLSKEDVTQLLHIVQPKVVVIFSLFNTLWERLTTPLRSSLYERHYIHHLTLQYIEENRKKNITVSHYRAYIIQKLIHDHRALVDPLIILLKKERETLITTYKNEEIDSIISIAERYIREKKGTTYHKREQAIRNVEPVNDIIEQDISQLDSPCIVDNVEDAAAIQLLCKFLTTDQLPVGYADPTDFIAQIIALIPEGICQKYLTLLCRQLSIAEKIIKYTSGDLRLLLRTILIPFDEPTINSLRKILLKADILHATILREKEDNIDTVLLQVVSKKNNINVYQLLYQSLLYIGEKSSLTQVELFRRVGIVVTQERFPTFITNVVIEMCSCMEQVIPTTIDGLDLAFIPAYDRLCDHLSVHIIPLYYQYLLPIMKEAVKKGIQPIYYKQQITEILYQHFSTVSIRKKQIVKEIICNTIAKVTAKERKKIQKKWQLFLKKGILNDDEMAHQLLNNFLSSGSTPSKNYFYKILQMPHVRKRLVTSLNSKYLEKIVATYGQYDQYDGLTFVKIIDTLCKLWSYIKIPHISSQDFKIIFWDAALENLVQEHTVQIPLWLSKSFITVSDVIKVPPIMLVSSLQIAVRNSADLNLNQNEITHMDNIFTLIQRKWNATAEKNAQKIWPHQPVLRNLHLLLTTGVNAFPDDYFCTLAHLDNQLQLLAQTDAPMLRKALLGHPQMELVARRLTYYFSNTTILSIIEILAQQFYPFVAHYNTFITENAIVTKIDTTPTTWQHHNNITILGYLLKNLHFDKQTFIHHCVTSLPCSIPNLLQLLQQHLLEDTCSLSHHEIKKFISTMKLPTTGISKNNKTEQNQTIEEVFSLQENITETTNMSQEAIRLYLPNAGIVLIWPFFEQLFERQGLMKEQKFLDEVSCHNAVHTLQYLTTGNLEPPEWQLVLSKLLCGMFYNDITTKAYQPRKESEAILCETKNADTGETCAEAYEITLLKKNCDFCITDAIQEWTSIASTETHLSGITVSQFREQFLMQEGILQYVEEHREDEAEVGYEPYWHLTIKMGLLGSMMKLPPWSMGEIFFPWMRHQIIIFWVP